MDENTIIEELEGLIKRFGVQIRHFTKGIEENYAENFLITHDKKLASIYIKNWQEHAQHPEVYVGRGK